VGLVQREIKYDKVKNWKGKIMNWFLAFTAISAGIVVGNLLTRLLNMLVDEFSDSHYHKRYREIEWIVTESLREKKKS